jgi:hypothetical protein
MMGFVDPDCLDPESFKIVEPVGSGDRRRVLLREHVHPKADKKNRRTLEEQKNTQNSLWEI